MITLASLYYDFTGMTVLFTHPLWTFVAFILGANVGSFLNVVIYRVPIGLSVHKPSRSFCPGCKKEIPWYRNLPLITWLVQRGKCAGCDGKISVRYFIVELLTAVLFAIVWYLFPGWEALLGWVFISLMVSVSFIDGEHYIIPVVSCWVWIAVAVVASYWVDGLVTLDGWFFGGGTVTGEGGDQRFDARYGGVPNALIGFLLGYLGLVAVVFLGKLAFGKKKSQFEKPEKWYLKEPQTDEEQLEFVIGDEQIGWGDMFYRPHDRIELRGSRFLVDGKRVKGEQMVIRAEQVEIGERVYLIEDLKSLEGEATEVVIPREAMGGGDPPFLGLIGAFLGPIAVIFTLFASSVYALIAAVLGRVGFGRPLPFGPFMALGAMTWLFGGHRLIDCYLQLIGY